MKRANLGPVPYLKPKTTTVLHCKKKNKKNKEKRKGPLEMQVPYDLNYKSLKWRALFCVEDFVSALFTATKHLGSPLCDTAAKLSYGAASLCVICKTAGIEAYSS